MFLVPSITEPRAPICHTHPKMMYTPTMRDEELPSHTHTHTQTFTLVNKAKNTERETQEDLGDKSIFRQKMQEICANVQHFCKFAITATGMLTLPLASYLFH